MAGNTEVALQVTFSRSKIERDYFPIRTNWQGDLSVCFVVGKVSRKVMALKPSEVKPNRYDVIAEAWISQDHEVKSRRNLRMPGLANDALPVVETALSHKFSPEPTISVALAN